MKSLLALKIVLCVGVFGLVFSGWLSYQELWSKTAIACPAPGAPGTVFGYPACVYGFFMYAVIVIVSTLGLVGNKNRS